jgi:hypothetical protein
VRSEFSQPVAAGAAIGERVSNGTLVITAVAKLNYVKF